MGGAAEKRNCTVISATSLRESLATSKLNCEEEGKEDDMLLH